MTKLVVPVLIIIFLNTPVIYSQKKNDVFKFGISGSGFVPYDEFVGSRRIKASWEGKLLARVGLADYLNGQFSGGIGEYKGLDLSYNYFKTKIYPFDFQLLFKFIKRDSYPYFYMGGGVMYYEVADPPAVVSPKNVKNKGYAAFAPVGIGVQKRLTEYTSIDVRAGITLTTTDNLNFYKRSELPDLYYSAGIGLLFGGGGPTDNDKDNLDSEEEEELGTDPDNPDTDSDGLNDGAEVNFYFTDPLNKDIDEDGLSDGDELKKYNSNPRKRDTDGDLLSDYEEVKDFKTDPSKRDTDGDGIEDRDEVRRYLTNPLKNDTDDDGLTDYEEITKHKTDPLTADTDADELSDSEEINKHKTDPLKKDTDGGSVYDGAEVKSGTNPLNPDDDIMKVGKPVVFEGINFEFNSASITDESEETLQKALQTLKNNPGIKVEISGHTDDIGSDEYNMELSLKRADVVRMWLILNGIEESRLVTKGYGESRPAAPNSNEETRRKNRRIEFLRLD